MMFVAEFFTLNLADTERCGTPTSYFTIYDIGGMMSNIFSPLWLGLHHSSTSLTPVGQIAFLIAGLREISPTSISAQSEDKRKRSLLLHSPGIARFESTPINRV